MSDEERMNAEALEQARRRKDDLTRSYASVVLPDDVVADCDASACVNDSTVKYDTLGRVDEYATIRNEGARMFWIRFRDRVAAAKRPRVEPVPTHAVSSTAQRTP